MQGEPNAKRASEGARFLVQGPQKSQSRFFEPGDYLTLHPFPDGETTNVTLVRTT